MFQSIEIERLSRADFIVWEKFIKWLRSIDVIIMFDFTTRMKWLWKTNNIMSAIEINHETYKTWFKQTDIPGVY